MNKTQQCGSIVLICLIVVTIVLPRLVSYYKQNNSQPDFSKFEEMKNNIVEYQEPEAAKQSETEIDTIFTFDPNKASYDDFVCLGLSEKIAANIVKYRKAGGRFAKPEDFSKIYGITDSVYERLSPYISIPQGTSHVAKNANQKKKKRTHIYNNSMPSKEKSGMTLSVVELNSADSAQLDALRGIGPVLAKRILAYRELLGGYYSVEQLREIRNLSDETYADLFMQFSVDTAQISKIDINNFTYKQLSKHPYMPIGQLNSIMNYKKLVGKFQSVGDLLKYKLVDSLTFMKMEPYLVAK